MTNLRPFLCLLGFPGGSTERICLQCRKLGLIPELGRFAEEGNGESLQYSCLGNPKDGGAWRAIAHVCA